MVTECAFGRLKARFDCLRQSMDIRLEENNFGESKNELVNQHRVAAAHRYDTEFQPSLDNNHV